MSNIKKFTENYDEYGDCVTCLTIPSVPSQLSYSLASSLNLKTLGLNILFFSLIPKVWAAESLSPPKVWAAESLSRRKSEPAESLSPPKVWARRKSEPKVRVVFRVVVRAVVRAEIKVEDEEAEEEEERMMSANCVISLACFISLSTQDTTTM